MRQNKLSIALSREALAARTASANGWLQGTPQGRTVRRAITGLVDIEIVDRSMTLAAKIFTAVLPVIIAGSIFTDWDLTTRAIDEQLGFDPTALSSGTGVLYSADPSFAAFGVVGMLMVAISGTSFARALARIYAKIWCVPSIGLRDMWRWLVVLLLVATSAGLVGAVREVAGVRYIGVPLAFIGEWVVWLLVWTVCPYLLTMGVLTGRVLWVTGLLTASGLTVARAVGGFVLPKFTATAQARFGPFGLVFTSISWLFVLSVMIVGAAAVSKTLALDEGWVGKYLRGPAPIA